MNPSDSHLPAALEAALNRVKTTVLAVAERVAVTLGAQAQTATRIFERDLIMATHIDLRRKINAFHLAFGETLTKRVQKEVLPRTEVRRSAKADWQSMTLVEDHEVEERMLAERIGRQISSDAEWELREVATYMGSLLGYGRADEERNPLRGDVLGTATFKGIVAITADPDGRKILAREFGNAMSQAMPACCKAIIAEMQARGVRPVSMSVKQADGPGYQVGGGNSGYSTLRDDIPPTRPDSGYGGGSGYSGGGDYGGADTARDTGPRGVGQPATVRGRSTNHAPFTGGRSRAMESRSRISAEADAQMMALLRRLTILASRPGALETGDAISTAYRATQPHGLESGVSTTRPTGLNRLRDATAAAPMGDAGLMAVNLIRAHREELMQASSGKLDHMVIDVVGSLFDQILSDPRVPPQMARQIARLQLPVLRVALVDASFFSSRRHPVRRFVNRIGSLAVAFEEFDEGPGKQLLERVRSLVQQIVEGDFDQIEVYNEKLAELESFITTQTRAEAESNGAAPLLESKESELRIQQRYMQKLRMSLEGVPIEPYLRDFIAQVWSQALVHATRQHGENSDVARRYKLVGRDLVLSVQPKGSPTMRKKFLMQLPTLMKDLNEGMKVIGWPEPAQKEFFSKLLPAHAESLKAPPITELQHNLLAKQLEGVFGSTIPAPGDFAHSESVALASEPIEPRFSPEEAEKIGLVQESAVDWSGEVDIDITAGEVGGDTVPGEAPSTEPLPLPPGIDINLDLVTADPAEPTRGAQLIDHIRIGFAYQMLLKDQWQKVRLSYVSPGRSFFVFSRGRKHQETISLTARMLARMCESNRLRAIESAYLMERATARARRQLAALKTPAKQ